MEKLPATIDIQKIVIKKDICVFVVHPTVNNSQIVYRYTLFKSR